MSAASRSQTREPQVVVGVDFPLTDGHRSTQATGRAVIAAALEPLDRAAAAAALATSDWRRGYLGHLRGLSTLELTVAYGAVAAARAGLDDVQTRFVFNDPLRPGDPLRAGDQLLAKAMAAGVERAERSPVLHSMTISGSAGRTGTAERDPKHNAEKELSVPFRGERLRSDALRRQLDRWVETGIAEPSFAEGVKAVLDQPDWLDLSDLTVVVLGAGAEMGPLQSLLRWGAHVVAVDLPRPAIWRRLIELARVSRGRLTLPLNRWLPLTASDEDLAQAAGVDVIAQTPDVLAWLLQIDQPLVLGNYLYADGAVHTRTSVAVDALTVALAERRPDLSLAFLATPTDAFAVPEQIVSASTAAYGVHDRANRLARKATGGHLYQPNYEGTLRAGGSGAVYGLCDALVPQQGPNYALAKRIQRWRAVLARAEGRTVSLNVAPATRTRSVVRNRLLAAAFAGAHRFGVEVFDPSTSNTVMAAMLVHDLRRGAVVEDHPLDLFWCGANHGGLWRLAYAPRSVLGIAVVLGGIQRRA